MLSLSWTPFKQMHLRYFALQPTMRVAMIESIPKMTYDLQAIFSVVKTYTGGEHLPRSFVDMKRKVGLRVCAIAERPPLSAATRHFKLVVDTGIEWNYREGNCDGPHSCSLVPFPTQSFEIRADY